MDTWTPTAPHKDRARLLLVGTDDLFLDDVGSSLQASNDVHIVARARSIDDAYECAAKYSPDVIVISWNQALRTFVHAAVERPHPPRTNPLIVIVLPGDITQTPGLGTLCLMPNVALVVHTQLEKLLQRHALQEWSGRMH